MVQIFSRFESTDFRDIQVLSEIMETEYDQRIPFNSEFIETVEKMFKFSPDVLDQNCEKSPLSGTGTVTSWTRNALCEEFCLL